MEAESEKYVHLYPPETEVKEKGINIGLEFFSFPNR